MPGKEKPSVQRIAELQQLIADFSRILRVLHLADTGRLENDVEHSFSLALTCWYLAPKIAPKLNLEKILRYSLAHDIVELHSGDTYVFDKKRVKTKATREKAALKQLRADWPDFTDLADAAQSYQDKQDAEARFVYTIDKMLPPIMINLGQKDKFWVPNKVTREMHEAEKRDKMMLSEEASDYCELLIEWLSQPDYFYKPD
jgi:putative hydrolase of HD superfamily